MNNNDKKRKVLQSLSAFAFALTVFAANSQGGGVSAETIDLTGGMAKSSVSDSQQEDGGSEETGEAEDQANGDNADDIATTYAEESEAAEEQSEAEYAEEASDEYIEESAEYAEESGETVEQADDVVMENAFHTRTNEMLNSTPDYGYSMAHNAPVDPTALLHAAQGYSVFIEGDYRQYGNGGNIDMGDGRAVVAVGGDMYFNVTKASSIEVGKTMHGSADGVRTAVGEECQINFSEAFADLRNTSQKMSALDGSVGVNSTDENNYIRNNYGSITFKGSNTDVNVFTLTVDEFMALKGGSTGVGIN